MSGRSAAIVAMLVIGLSEVAPVIAGAQGVDSVRTASGIPSVVGGYDDKPYLDGIFGRVRVGGYVEFAGAWDRADGATEELGFELTRLSLMTSTNVRDRVQLWTEIEFEEGGSEIDMELAQLDFRITRAASLRGGILLVPLGRFNLAHDGPRTELPRRPVLATELIGSALSQPGLGLFGEFPTGSSSRLNYEAYAVNGYHAGIVEDSPDGTRLPAGQTNPEDKNASPAWVGRIAWTHGRGLSLGVSGYAGAYNRFHLDGLDVEDRRDLDVGVVDAEWNVAGIQLSGEAAIVDVEIPPFLGDLVASRQAGATLQLSRSFGVGSVKALPDSWFTLAVRGEAVDFDRELIGDSTRNLTVGLNFRPVRESVIKFAITRSWNRDRFDNEGLGASWVLGLASYF